jgi:hypothetical protein
VFVGGGHEHTDYGIQRGRGMRQFGHVAISVGPSFGPFAGQSWLAGSSGPLGMQENLILEGWVR